MGSPEIAAHGDLPIPIADYYADVFPKHLVRRELLGLGAVGLTLIGSVYAVQADTDSFPIARYVYRVAVNDAQDLPGEFGRLGRGERGQEQGETQDKAGNAVETSGHGATLR